MKDKKRLIILIVVIVITLIICGIIIHSYLKEDNSSPAVPEVVVTNNIDKYGYVLTDKDTDYYKELFGKLKNALNAEKMDEELYASLVGQLFVTDFYTLDNKLSSSDVGGLQFILSDYKDNFALKAKDTMYKTVKSNLYNDRKQDLPIVSKASVDSVTKTTYKYGDVTDSNAYSVSVTVTYETDMGYPKSVKVVLVHNNDKLEIAKVS